MWPSNLFAFLGHFSQVVWRDSRELGVAVAHSRSGQIFVVCNYLPPGNFIGSFSENVPPLGWAHLSMTLFGLWAIRIPINTNLKSFQSRRNGDNPRYHIVYKWFFLKITPFWLSLALILYINFKFCKEPLSFVVSMHSKRTKQVLWCVYAICSTLLLSKLHTRSAYFICWICSRFLDCKFMNLIISAASPRTDWCRLDPRVTPAAATPRNSPRRGSKCTMTTGRNTVYLNWLSART